VIDTAQYGPWALIAGGSEGVGAEFAQLLAAAGLNLVLVARNKDALEQTADRCRRNGGVVRTVQADLSAPVALFLAGEGCRYLTGNTLFVDSGSHINGVAWTPDLDAAT
jgi:enoyl-[acyl-carrier-protein] reductase (NADH)